MPCNVITNKTIDNDNLYTNELNKEAKIKLSKKQINDKWIILNGNINKNRSLNATVLEEFDSCLLRRKINYLQRDKNLKITTSILRDLVFNEINFTSNLHSCLKIVHDLGFQYRKSGKEYVLTENETTRFQRLQYIKSIKTYRLEQRSIVFIKEYFLDYRNRMLDALTKREAYFVSEKVQMICGIECFGYEAQHLNLPILLIELKDFQYDIYENEIKKKLLSILPSNSVIVIDNISPFHRVLAHTAPKSTASVDQMLQWLHERNQPFNVASNKVQIYEQILEHKKKLPKEYKIDMIFQKYNHTVLRLPNAHPELSPVHCFWACVTTQQFKNRLSVEKSRELSLCRYRNIDTNEWAFVCENVIVNEDFLVDQEDVDDELVKLINSKNEQLLEEQQIKRTKVQFKKLKKKVKNNKNFKQLYQQDDAKQQAAETKDQQLLSSQQQLLLVLHQIDMSSLSICSSREESINKY